MNKGRVWLLVSALPIAAMLLNACGPAGATQVITATPAPTTVGATAAATQAPATAAATAPPTQIAAGQMPAASPTAAGSTCGTDPVVLNAYFETGFDIPFKLSEEFTKQFPNVTWDIKQDQFTNLINETPRLLSGDKPPDLIRLPTMVSFAKQGLLKNLDSYATAFGWDKWPVPQLNQNRVAVDGTRGSGSLYAMGLNYSLTGIFYNKKLTAQIGMTEPPKTVAEFENLLAKAKAAGLLPIMQWGSAKSGMGLAFPLQNLMAAYGPVGPINAWNSGSRTATSLLTSTPSSILTPTPASARARGSSSSTVTGRTLGTTRTCPAMSGSS
jgi:raffinose/stachyose/melibiose transport system substrate-binding protein